MGIPAASVNAAVAAMTALAKAYEAIDASLAEINPFILTEDGKVYALDAKITLDDNALYRHKDLLELRDLNEEDPLEVEASRFSLNYIKLDGNIACMVNGAGLAMATMDIVKYAGGSPANFPGCGRRRERGTDQERVSAFCSPTRRESGADQYLRRHPALRCAGHRSGKRGAGIERKVPVVVRMEGTNVEKGREILKEFRFQFHRSRRNEGRRGESSGERGAAMSVFVDQIRAFFFRASPAREASFHAQAPSITGPK